MNRAAYSKRYLRDLDERNRRIRAGLCARCGKPNDRLVEALRKSNKEGKSRITQCSACVSESRKHGKNDCAQLSTAERQHIEAQLAKETWW